MRKKGLSLVVVLCLSFVGASPTARADSPRDLLVIVNSSLPQDAITAAELNQIFLRLRTAWPSGRTIVPVHQPPGSPARLLFLRNVLGMSEAEEKRYWEGQKVQKGVTAPASFTNVGKAVFKLSGAVSYVFRREYREGTAKVVLVIQAATFPQTSSE